MPLPQTVQAQRDFSAGEVDITIKRDEESPVYKAGLRQARNVRILDTKKLSNRFGRSAKFIDGPRIDEVLMSPGNSFLLCFSTNTLTIRNAAGLALYTAGGLPWLTAQVGQIEWEVVGLNIYICFNRTQPIVVTWDGTSVWSLAYYAEAVSLGNQKRTLFYRISPPSITLLPSAVSGNINITFSANVLVAGMIGTRLRYCNRQIMITGVTSGLAGTASVQETLFESCALTLSGTPDIRTVASVGDVVIGSISGAKAVVTAFTSSSVCTVQMLTATEFIITTDIITGPGGSMGALTSFTRGTPQAVTVWDDEVMNAYRGWPSSVFADQNRLGFCNIPSVPAGIAWSAIGVPTDLYVGATPDDAIFEPAPGKSQVLYVLPGAESSEFVFCDNAVYYIPITPTNPLKPGSVAFQKISGDGSAAVRPRLVQDAIVYVSAGGSTVRAVTATGAYLRPYEVRHISRNHDHLLAAPIAIASPSATDSHFPERYIYLLNSDGTAAVAKIVIEDGQLKQEPGWVLHSGVGSITWISARSSSVWFTTAYSPNGITPTSVAEMLDPTQYLDAAITVNSPPASLASPGGGLGPLWWLANGSVTLLDLGTRQMGLYQIDASGNIVPQFIGGEDLTSVTLVAGQAWSLTVEPFIPAPGPGQDVKQRMVRRKVGRMAVYVQNSSGFLLARLFAGPLTRTSPALGAVMNIRRVTTYNQDDDPTIAPPLREGAEFWRPSGRSHDPRVAVMKDTAGPLNILEIGLEVTV